MFQTLLSNTLYTLDQQLYLIVCLYIQMQMQIYFKNLDNLKYTQCFQDFSCHLDAHYTFTCLSCSSQRSPSPGPNHTCSSNASTATVVPQNASARPACSLTPTLAAHFNDNLIKHVQGWPADHAEKQVYLSLVVFLLLLPSFPLFSFSFFLLCNDGLKVSV